MRMGLGIVLLVIGFLLANIHFAQAQQAAKIPRIGFLTGAALSTQFARMDAFREGLRDLGYVEGKNIVIDWRSYEGKRDRQRVLVGELVDLKADVIVAVGVGDIRAVKDATTTIPIVMLVGGDPVASGFVSSLACFVRFGLLKQLICFLEGFAGVFVGACPSRDAYGITGLMKIQRRVLV